MRTLIRVTRPCVVVCLFLLTTSAVAKAQCVGHPSRETAVVVVNASNYFLTFYIDGVKRGDVTPGERSIDLIVPAGEHLLLAETTIGGELVSPPAQL